jgi:hypothetical protein
MCNGGTMDLFELIGFIIMAVVLISPIVKKFKEEKLLRGNQTVFDKGEQIEVVKDREDVIKEFLKSIDLDIEEEKKTPPSPPPPPPLPSRKVSREEARNAKFAFKGQLSQRHQKSSIEDRHIETNIKDDGGAHLVSKAIAEVPKNQAYSLKEHNPQSYIRTRIVDRESRRDLLLMYEVLSPPLSMRMDVKW